MLRINRGDKTAIELFRPPISELELDVAELIRDATPEFQALSGGRTTG